MLHSQLQLIANNASARGGPLEVPSLPCWNFDRHVLVWITTATVSS